MIKLQWHTMTDFARNILKKMGAVPVSDLNEAYREIDRLGGEIDSLAYRNAKDFPYMIEPTTLISYDRAYHHTRFRLKSRNLDYVLDDYMVNSLGNPEYKRFLVRYLSSKWAEQTGEILEEILEQRQ
jgi:hypothetical protein